MRVLLSFLIVSSLMCADTFAGLDKSGFKRRSSARYKVGGKVRSNIVKGNINIKINAEAALDALVGGSLADLKSVLSRRPILLLTTKDRHGGNLLHSAAQLEFFEEAALLIRKYKIRNQLQNYLSMKDDLGDTPLHVALGSAVYSRGEVALLLIQHADTRALNSVNADGLTPLSFARVNNSRSIVEALEARQEQLNRLTVAH